jgi:hypothetical protein
VRRGARGVRRPVVAPPEGGVPAGPASRGGRFPGWASRRGPSPRGGAFLEPLPSLGRALRAPRGVVRPVRVGLSPLPEGKGEVGVPPFGTLCGGASAGFGVAVAPEGAAAPPRLEPFVWGSEESLAPGWRVRFRPGVASVFIACGDRCPRAPVVAGQRRGAGTAGRSRRSLRRLGPGALVPQPVAARSGPEGPSRCSGPEGPLPRPAAPRLPWAAEAAWGVWGRLLAGRAEAWSAWRPMKIEPCVLVTSKTAS